MSILGFLDGWVYGNAWLGKNLGTVYIVALDWGHRKVGKDASDSS